MIEILKKGQTWSFDLLVALTIFIGIFITFYALISYSTSVGKEDVLAKESETIINSLSGNIEEISFIDGNIISEEKLEELADADYDTVRTILGVRNDFCIYIEDDKGNLINISDKLAGFGSPNANISGKYCGR